VTLFVVAASGPSGTGRSPKPHLLGSELIGSANARWQTQSVLGADTVQVRVTVDRAASRLVAVAALDNLTKGTAGGAVQCMNLALALPETTGLPLVGVAQ
jgi:N-acetyl-gamma-glutamylphosphate reductase